MSNDRLPLREVDRVEILVLIDNYVDLLLQNTDIVTRPPRAEGDEIPSDTFLAEHGLSLLITVYREENRRSILFDTGYSQIAVPHNMEPERVPSVALLVGRSRPTPMSAISRANSTASLPVAVLPPSM